MKNLWFLFILFQFKNFVNKI